MEMLVLVVLVGVVDPKIIEGNVLNFEDFVIPKTIFIVFVGQ